MAVAVAVSDQTRGEPAHEVVNRFIERLEARRYAASTIRLYRKWLHGLVECHAGVPFERMTARHIESYLYSRWTLGNRSKAHVYASLRSFFKYLVQIEELVTSNPCEKVDRPRYQPRLRQAPSFEDFEAMRSRCTEPYLRVFLELCYFSGLRLREALFLRIAEIDLRTRQIRVLHGKGDKDRVVFFIERVGVLLKEFIGNRPRTDYLFAVGPSEEWNPARQPRDREKNRFAEANRHYGDGMARIVQRDLRNLAKAAGIPFRISPHVLRHGFTKRCKLNGVPIEVTAKLLGHASINTTAMQYGQLDVSDLQRVYDKHITGADQ